VPVCVAADPEGLRHWFSWDMRRRLLLLDLDPVAPALAPRISPTLLLPLPDGRAAVPLEDESPEAVLASLLADGVPIRSSRLIGG
jgi:hypothetical protein